MLSIDIGCGTRRHPKATVGVDILALPGVDKVCNFETDPLPFEDNSVDAVYTSHTLEHIRNLDHLLREIVRVAKPDAPVHVVVPHFSNTLGHSDPTHKRLCGLYMFNYYSREKDAHWPVAPYTSDIWFKIRRRYLKFKNRAFDLHRIWERWHNRSEAAQHEYELNAYRRPCYEIHFELAVDK